MSDGGPEEYLNGDAKVSDARPKAVQTLLETFAETMENAPEDYRYDMELTVREYAPDNPDE